MVANRMQRQESGYIALLAVLIVGAAALAISLALLSASADSQRSALVNQQSKQSRALGLACAQEALQVIRDNTSYTGTNNLTLGQGNCSYTITSTGASTRTIAVTASVNNTTRKLDVRVTIGALNISITSWQEVS